MKHPVWQMLMGMCLLVITALLSWRAGELEPARQAGAGLLCFGHTHEAVCEFQQGLWVVNPGSIGSLANPTYAVAILQEDGAVCYLSTM